MQLNTYLYLGWLSLGWKSSLLRSIIYKSVSKSKGIDLSRWNGQLSPRAMLVFAMFYRLFSVPSVRKTIFVEISTEIVTVFQLPNSHFNIERLVYQTKLCFIAFFDIFQANCAYSGRRQQIYVSRNQS